MEEMLGVDSRPFFAHDEKWDFSNLAGFQTPQNPWRVLASPIPLFGTSFWTPFGTLFWVPYWVHIWGWYLDPLMGNSYNPPFPDHVQKGYHIGAWNRTLLGPPFGVPYWVRLLDHLPAKSGGLSVHHFGALQKGESVSDPRNLRNLGAVIRRKTSFPLIPPSRARAYVYILYL